MTRERGRPPHPDQLTPAEWRVVEAVRHGLTNRAIAERQGVSIDAVKFHVSNALGKLGLARRSELRQWEGVRLDSEMARHRRGDDDGVALGALGQVARSVADIDAATCWYRDVLGLPHLYSFGGLAFFDCDGVRLLLSQEGGAAASILYFRVADIHAAQRRLESRGARFVSAPHLIHTHGDGVEEWMAFLHDNEDRPLALMSQIQPVTALQGKEKRDDRDA